MSEYREDLGAMRERIDALREELAETKRALEEARTVAGVHEHSRDTLQRQLKSARPSRGRSAVLFAAGVLVGGGVTSALLSWEHRYDRMKDLVELQRQCAESRKICEDMSRR
jgi:hypothetical protein